MYSSKARKCSHKRKVLCCRTQTEYDIASLYMVSFYCFVAKACARRPSAAASVERRRHERRTLLAGVAGELARATRLQQVRPSSACTFSDAYVFTQACARACRPLGTGTSTEVDRQCCRTIGTTSGALVLLFLHRQHARIVNICSKA